MCLEIISGNEHRSFIMLLLHVCFVSASSTAIVTAMSRQHLDFELSMNYLRIIAR